MVTREKCLLCDWADIYACCCLKKIITRGTESDSSCSSQQLFISSINSLYLRNLKVHYYHERPILCLITKQFSLINRFTFRFPKIQFNKIPLSTSRSPKLCIPFMFWEQQFKYISYFSIHASRSVHPTLLDLIALIILI
jgi:hypothetical protein